MCWLSTGNSTVTAMMGDKHKGDPKAAEFAPGGG